jgi:hypothetical protein
MAALDIPNPLELPGAWDTVSFTENKTRYTWPLDEEFGVVEWSDFEPGVSLDKKTKSGAAKPKVTTTNGKPVEFSFTMRIVPDEAEGMRTAAEVIDKLRPGAGPFTLHNHPWAAVAGVRAFVVGKVKYQPPADGELIVAFSCVQIDPDAQSGTGNSVVKTPSKEASLKRAQDEWLARARQAQAFTNNQVAIDTQNRADAAAERGDPAGMRVPKKVQSVFVGEDEIGTTPSVPKQADAGNVATGSVNG